jgi:hypothetical protein
MGCGACCGDKHDEQLLNLPVSFVVIEPFVVHSTFVPERTQMSFGAAFGAIQSAAQDGQQQQQQPGALTPALSDFLQAANNGQPPQQHQRIVPQNDPL